MPERLGFQAIIARMIANATDANQEISVCSRKTRSTWLANIGQAVEQDAEQFVDLIVRFGSKTIRQARAEVSRCAETFHLASMEALALAGKECPFDQSPAGHDRFGMWVRKPIGIIVGITPYNDPLNLVAHKIAPALAVGAAVIVKPHPRTLAVADLLLSKVVSAGVPGNSVQLANCTATETTQLVAMPEVAVVSFTGGKAGGTDIAHAAAGKRILMELGGVNTTVVDRSLELDVKLIAKQIASGIAYAAGQNCIHTQRIIIHGHRYDAIVAALVLELEELRVGDQTLEETDVGPLTTIEHAKMVYSQIASALSCGAQILHGGSGEGRYVQPTLLSSVPANHPILNTEIFGPVAIVERASDFDEILELSKRCVPMINASIYSVSLPNIIRFFESVNAGTVIVNDSTDFRVDNMPFGGNGSAGVGREGIRFAIEQYTEPKLLCIRR
ncbi:MAG: aldehyde dehydrogenase family protein [Pseudomonadota bacterium]